MKICLIQNKPTEDKIYNFEKIEALIPNQKFDLLVLPECFNSPYGIEFFKSNAEEIKPNNLTFDFLKKMSCKYKNSYLIGGSYPELDSNKIYNTCTIWKNGNLISKYRKINLFDNNIPNAAFKESKVLSPGNKPCIIKTDKFNLGIGICFDMRFNQLSNFYAKNKCKIICYPASFTEFTGKMHWELLNKVRAIDSQCFIVSCATAINEKNNFKSYGNSIIVSPWGKIVNKLDNNEGYILEEINLEEAEEIRNVLPINQNKIYL